MSLPTDKHRNMAAGDYGIRTEMQYWKAAVLLRDTVPRSNSQQLSLVRVEFETVSGHPVADV